MQDRYVGDVGDYVKYALLRRLAPGHRLGLAWYLHPDEGHNNDGRHDAYLADPAGWGALDAPLFEALRGIRARGGGVAAVEAAGLLPGARFSGQRLRADGPPAERARWRGRWFEGLREDLAPCDLVFADPDNGLCPDERYRAGRRLDWKRIPLSEARALAEGRCAVVYHHNSRRKGGHVAEIRHWLARLPAGTLALRARAGSARTFFVLHPSPAIEARLRAFAADWAAARVDLHSLGAS